MVSSELACVVAPGGVKEEETFFCERGADDLPLAATLHNLLFAFFFHQHWLFHYSLLLSAHKSQPTCMHCCLLLLGKSVHPPKLCSVSVSVCPKTWLYQSTHPPVSNAWKILPQLARHREMSPLRRFKIKGDSRSDHCCSSSKRQVINFPLSFLLVAAEHLTSFPGILAACSLNFPAS